MRPVKSLLEHPEVNGFVDGVLLVLSPVYRVSRYLDGLGRRMADWLLP